MQYVGYMIYEAQEGEKNKSFVSMFARAGKKFGLRFLLVTKEQYRTKALPDFVLNRTRDPAVSAYYETYNIPVFHTSDIVRIGNDKAQTIEKLKQSFPSEMPLYIPKSMEVDLTQFELEDTFADDCANAQKAADEWQRAAYMALRERVCKWQEEIGMSGENVVLKAVDGHGGSEVFKVAQAQWDQIETTKSQIKPLLHRKILCQEYIESDSRDIRVYVIGGRPYAAVLRQGTKDFRSNYSLGGSVQLFAIDPPMKQMLQKYIDALGGRDLSFVGVDFLPDQNGRLIFNELEEMVGCRMLYACSDYDIVSDYVMWLAKCIQK